MEGGGRKEYTDMMQVVIIPHNLGFLSVLWVLCYQYIQASIHMVQETRETGDKEAKETYI